MLSTVNFALVLGSFVVAVAYAVATSRLAPVLAHFFGRFVHHEPRHLPAGRHCH